MGVVEIFVENFLEHLGKLRVERVESLEEKKKKSLEILVIGKSLF